MQHSSDRLADYGGVGAAEECIVDVLAMKRWWNTELIGVGVIPECSIEVVVIASEFRNELFSALRPVKCC